MPLLSAAGGGLVVLVVMLAAAGLSARAGHGPGVGGGDVKLLSAVGFWVGPVGGLLVVGLSCAVGLVGWCLGRTIAAARTAGGAHDGGIPLAPAVAVVVLPMVLVCHVGAAPTL